MYYKFLDEDSAGPFSGFDFTPYLPTDDQPGPWLPEVEHLEFCESGYHACTRDNLARWLDAQMWEIEYQDEPEDNGDKVNGACIRFVRRVDTWNDKNARLFAVWCAREALKLVDDPDPRSVTACDVAERYANGEANVKELVAARDAAGAAGSAAWSAARDAARAAAGAAGAAAWSAAWYAARAAAGAAGSAARSAARDAAGAAGSAAWSAAGAAAWAAGAAQSEKLIEMLGL